MNIFEIRDIKRIWASIPSKTMSNQKMFGLAMAKCRSQEFLSPVRIEPWFPGY